MTANTRARNVAKLFLRGDDYISRHERHFDNQWEAGDGNEVARHFHALYSADLDLQRQCKLSRYFSPAMVNVAPDLNKAGN